MWIQVKTFSTTFLKLQSNRLQHANTLHFDLQPSQRAALNLVLHYFRGVLINSALQYFEIKGWV